MMGRLKDDQGQLFYDLCLEKLVPSDHLVRKIGAVLDLSWVSRDLAPYYSHTGRRSIDPELMIRMLIVGYVFAIRSERQLCTEVQVNLAYHWFCGLSVEDSIPDHSVFSRARHERFCEADVLRRVFEGVVRACIEKGLVVGDSFSVDASLIRADVDPVKRVPGDQPVLQFQSGPVREKASRAVREYLRTLDEESADANLGASGRTRKPRMAISLTDPQAARAASFSPRQTPPMTARRSNIWPNGASAANALRSPNAPRAPSAGWPAMSMSRSASRSVPWPGRRASDAPAMNARRSRWRLPI